MDLSVGDTDRVLEAVSALTRRVEGMKQACDLMSSAHQKQMQALRERCRSDKNSADAEIAGLRHTVHALQLQIAVAVENTEDIRRRSEKGPLRWFRRLCAAGP